MKSLALRTEQTLAEPNILDNICKHVSCGGTLRSWCNNLNLLYSDVIWWIQDNPTHHDAYKRAIVLREEWIRESLVGNLAEIAQFDVGTIVDSDGNIAPASEWPEHARKAVQSITTSTDALNNVRTTVRLPERLKAYELVGRAFAIWKDKVDIQAEVSIADLVMQASRQVREE